MGRGNAISGKVSPEFDAPAHRMTGQPRRRSRDNRGQHANADIENAKLPSGSVGVSGSRSGRGRSRRSKASSGGGSAAYGGESLEPLVANGSEVSLVRERKLVHDAQTRISRNPGPGLRAKFRRLRSRMTPMVDSNLITNHIILGNRESAMNADKLRSMGVTHVLNVCHQLPNFHPKSFVYVKVEIVDHPDSVITNIATVTTDFLRRVEQLNGRALVHCVAGVSRSASAVIMFLMQHHDLTLKQAWLHIKSHRPHVSPNEGFKLQLARMELDDYGGSSVADPSAGTDWDFYAWNSEKQTAPRRIEISSGDGGGRSLCAVS